MSRFLIILAVPLLACISCASSTPHDFEPGTVNSSRALLRDAVKYGRCEGDQNVDMRSVESLTGDRFTISRPTFEVTLTIVGERVHQEWKRPNARRTWQDIEAFVVDADGDVDVIASFVKVGDVVSIYWRETYLHRSYRQGVLGIGADGLYALCQGAAGADASP